MLAWSHARHRRLTLVALLVAASSCTNQNADVSKRSAQTSAPRGGTLRIAVPNPGPSVFTDPDNPQRALDPDRFNWYDSTEIFRCCLARTLFSYVGRATKDGGSILRPDAAASLATVSGDGLTWTIRLKPRLHYGPPLRSVEITAADFIRSIQRSLKVEPASLQSSFNVVRGAAEYAQGKADSIAGLEAVDRNTLRLSLTQATGDLGARLALVAPIPPNPSNASARFGVAEGHDNDFGRFLVSSGPYMVEGSEKLDFSKPASAQTPLSGFRPGQSLTLVRNPSWRAAADQLRPAYVDRIEIAIGRPLEENAKLVDTDELDFVLSSGPPPQSPIDQIQRYRNNADSASRVFINSRDFVRTIVMNVGVPPFDDLHVRRAVNYVIDKRRLQELGGGPLVHQIAGHIILNSLENNLLVNYGPYATANRGEAVAKARAEMRQSKYPVDAEGRCTANVCRGILAQTFVPGVAVGAAREIEIKQAALIKQELAEIGIHINVKVLSPMHAFDDLLGDPRRKLPLHLRVGFGKGTISAADIVTADFYGPNLGDQASNGTLVGASPEQLRRWGYSVTSVPNVDDRVKKCLATVGNDQFRCWAELDQYLMEEVAPWVPYFFENDVRTVGSRVIRYSFCQLTALPALDQIALRSS